MISSLVTFTKEELKEALVKGQLTLQVNGKTIVAFCRDYHMAYAILLAETKGYLSQVTHPRQNEDSLRPSP